MNATADATTFAIGDEVSWSVEIPGLGISVNLEALVLTVEQDENVGTVLTLLPWGQHGQHLRVVAYSNPTDPEFVALEVLSLTGRAFEADHLARIVASHENC